MLKKFLIPLAIDRYTGSNFSMDDLSRLGFTKVKIDRKLVHNIDVDRGRLAALIDTVRSHNASIREPK